MLHHKGCLAEWQLHKHSQCPCILSGFSLCDAEELGEAQPSGEASAVDHESEQRPDAKKGRKGKKKAKVAAVAAAAMQQAETAGSTPSRRSVIMDPSKGMLQLHPVVLCFLGQI